MTEAIFIDTSIFMAENFFHGVKIRKLGTLGNRSHVQLYVTSVVDGEMKANLVKQSKEFSTAVDAFSNAVSRKHRVIKNLIEVEDIWNTENDFTSQLLAKYEGFKEFAKIQVIQPNGQFSVTKLLQDYFEGKPPFDNEKKKCEFPDAISLQIIDNWRTERDVTVTHLSNDANFSAAEVQGVYFKSSLSEELNRIVRVAYPESFRDEDLVYNYIEDYKTDFIDLVAFEVQLEVALHFDALLQGNLEVLADDIQVDFVTMTDYSAFNIDERNVEFIGKGVYKATAVFDKFTAVEIERINLNLMAEDWHIDSTNRICVTGEYEMFFRYGTEYSYEVAYDMIEFDEDEKKLRSINKCI